MRRAEMRLRAVELRAVDVPKAAQFLEQVWGLYDAGTSGKTRYWRATANHPYVLSLTEAAAPGVEAITFAGTESEVSKIPGQKLTELDAPGGGAGVMVEGPEGQRYRFVVDTPGNAFSSQQDRPIQLSHVV